MGNTSKDWIQLSAYIDGELSRREEELLKIRIKSDPQLQAVLDQLRTTKGILRSVPSLSVPRNFTITSKMVGKIPRKPVAAGYRLAAAMMSFLLIGVLFLDFGRLFLGGAMAPAAPMMEEALLESAAKEVSDTVISDVEGEVHQDRMAAEPGEEAPIEEAAPAAEAEFMVEPEVAEEGVAEAVAEKEVVEEILGTEMDAAGEEKSGSEDAAETETNVVDEGEQLLAADQSLPSQTPQPQPTGEYFYPEADIYSPPWYSRIPVFRILELLLGLGVIGFGAAAWIIRRR